jgi:hypothetical protein
MDQGPEASDGVALLDGILHHLDRTLDAETETVFTCQ